MVEFLRKSGSRFDKIARVNTESCGAAADIDSFRVLSTSSYELDFRILESLFIFKTKPDLNKQLSSYPLSIVKT